MPVDASFESAVHRFSMDVIEILPAAMSRNPVAVSRPSQRTRGCAGTSQYLTMQGWVVVCFCRLQLDSRARTYIPPRARFAGEPVGEDILQFSFAVLLIGYLLSG
jgi:hypothetical protein